MKEGALHQTQTGETTPGKTLAFFFSQIAGSKASDGYCTTYSHFLQGLQVVKPEKATALLTAHFFKRLQVLKPEKATALLTAHFFQRLQVVKPKKATALLTAHFFQRLQVLNLRRLLRYLLPIFSRDCR